MLSFQTAVLALALLGSGQGETVLLDFCADWCIPCRQMDPVVRELTARGYPVRKINIDRDRALAAQYGVNRVPCFVMLVDGQVVDRVVGGTTFSRLERMCQLAQACTAGPQAPSREPPAPPAGSDQTFPAVRSDAPFAGPHQRSATGPSVSQAHTPVSLAGWRQGTPDARGPTDPSGPSDDRLIAATVRLRIEDPNGHSCGSGTIIDARDGEALILTCGHIFRDSRGQGRIDVDVFGPNGTERVRGRLLSYDIERQDLGLLTIPIRGSVVTARVAPPGYPLARHDRVVNVGCNNGEPPTARHSRITAIDRYDGAPNLEVAGMPVLGRSGGGLFSEAGLLIGVCFAADEEENKGLYSAVGAIREELDKAGLSFVYRGGTGSPVGEGSLAALEPPAVPRRMPPPGNVAQAAIVPATASADNAFPADRTERQATPARGQLSSEEQAALEEIRRRRREGAEVVCVIRSRSNPRAPSEIIVLDHVSSGFLNQLAAEGSVEGPSAPHFTSLEVPDAAKGTLGPTAGAYRGAPATQPLIEYGTADRSPLRFSRSLPRQHPAMQR